MPNSRPNLDVFEQQQFKIAKRTLQLTDAGALIMGGMTKTAARKFLKERCGWSDDRIAKFEGATTENAANG